VGSTSRRGCALVGAALAALALTGCASTEEAEVERVATTFEDTSADPESRCGLLAPKTREQLETSGSCASALGDLPLEGGEVESVEVWGGDAQVRLTDDTLFLTRTSAGWKVAAAACTPQAEGPYDCDVEGA
jgi:hypothetical protein